MKKNALIVESTRLFQNVLEQIMNSAGVECTVFSSAKEALEAEHNEYAFILVSRTLKDLSGEVFLQRFGIQNNLIDTHTVLITSADIEDIKAEAYDVGYKYILNKNNVSKIQETIINILNTHILELDADILFIEDTQSIADLVVSLFKEHKSIIHHVHHLDEMKLAFNDGNFELVITDYYLNNNETGDDVISYIRNHDDNEKANIPILVVSGESDQKKRTSFLRNGANDFILKPYDNDELLVRASNLISNHRIIKQSKLQQQQLKQLALTDHLTGLYNRHSLYDLGPKYISNAHRHNVALSLLVIDLDHFKNVNDTHGHSVGDIVLQVISKVLKDHCRTEDIAARYGGEEFIMLLTNCDLENAAQKAEKLRKAIENCKPENLTITSSIGLAELSEKEDIDALFIRADKAVYEAKETGRNKVVTNK